MNKGREAKLRLELVGLGGSNRALKDMRAAGHRRQRERFDTARALDGHDDLQTFCALVSGEAHAFAFWRVDDLKQASRELALDPEGLRRVIMAVIGMWVSRP